VTLGTVETTVPTVLVTDAPPTLYFPEHPKVVSLQHAYQMRAIDVLVKDPAEGPYRETDVTAGGPLLAQVQGQLKGTLQRRLPLSAWQGTVRMWRCGGGDRVRSEYEKYWESLH
jgi:putative aldouronate transport system substrate-binding protein